MAVRKFLGYLNVNTFIANARVVRPFNVARNDGNSTTLINLTEGKVYSNII